MKYVRRILEVYGEEGHASDMYVLIVNGAVIDADMYAIKLIKWSKGRGFVSGKWKGFKKELKILFIKEWI